MNVTKIKKNKKGIRIKNGYIKIFTNKLHANFAL